MSSITPCWGFVVKGNRKMGWRKRARHGLLLYVCLQESFADENDPAATGRNP